MISSLLRRNSFTERTALMIIGLIAHDEKKELMTQFCIAYCGILSKHTLCSTATTGKLISEATGLTIEKLLSSRHGGMQQMVSRIAYNEIDVLFFLRETGKRGIMDETESELFRLCDMYNVPFATNLASAEAIILALGRGDLDWRNIMNSRSQRPTLSYDDFPFNF